VIMRMSSFHGDITLVWSIGELIYVSSPTGVVEMNRITLAYREKN